MAAGSTAYAGLPSAPSLLAMEDQLRFENVIRLLPPDWQAALASAEVEPVLGMGAAPVFRVVDSAGGCKYLKLASGIGVQLLTQEMARTEWLSSHRFRVPQFLMKICTRRVAAVLMTAVPGRHLTLDTDDLLGAVHAMGRGLARLHAVPSANCPFDETPHMRLERAREAIEQNLIDASQFDDRNAGLTPSMLYQRLVAAIPACEDVVVHGDATLSNLLIGPDRELGFIDCGHSGRSDRYVDLAVIVAELLTEFGRDAAECFKDAYGIREWNNRKAAFFRDLYELF